jgi:hypothetical protein
VSVDFDVSELRKFATDLGDAPAEVALEVRAIIQHGSLNIKKQLISEMAASEHFKGAASSITYDTVIGTDGIEAQIGPDKSRGGGALANIAYFGTSRGGGTVPDPKGALEAEVPNVEKFIADAIEKAVST